MLAFLKLDLQTHTFPHVSILHKRNANPFTSAWMLFKLLIQPIEPFISKSVPIVLSIQIHKGLGGCDCFKVCIVSDVFLLRYVHE